MDIAALRAIFSRIAGKMAENRDYLISLDQQNGDGDLGISMSDGYAAASTFLNGSELTDLGMALNKAANVFNENAPSSLGTITAFIMKGMARSLKGMEQADCAQMGAAMIAGLENVTAKAGSKRGEKTILDSLYPGAEALAAAGDRSAAQVIAEAAEAAAQGSEATRQMRAVWGRAAYFGDQSLGVLDGGSAVGKLVFEALRDWSEQAL